MPGFSPRVLVYVRVSTAHHEQKPEIQLEELRDYCRARGWQSVEEIVDHGYSGGNDQRPGLRRLMELARRRKADVVLVSKLDRLARSLRHLVSLLEEFSTLGVQFISLGDQVDLGTAGGRLMAHLLGAFAEFERSLIRERTIAGIQHARRCGKRLGRPQTRDDGQIRALRAAGLSYTAIQQRLGISRGAVGRALRGWTENPPSIEAKKSREIKGDK